ncbi:MAG: NAD(+) synthase [Myxococcales bacterium]|nr:NAD(+) synthase [Myxococcales bacterium]
MIKDICGLISAICQELRSFTDIAVFGMSGGADSTLVAALCSEALGAENVKSLHMPYNELDKETFNSRSMSAAKRLGIGAKFISIGAIAEALNAAVAQVADTPTSQLNAGNGRSRARMTLLYGASAALAEANPGKRVRVIGTGNLSEDYIGYDTKGGDALADIFPIGELFKSEVYQLLEHFRDAGKLDEDHIDRVPSAGLWDGQTDEDELGFSYYEMEPVIRQLLNGDTPPDAPVSKLVQDMRAANKHKHEAPPSIVLRNFCD